LSSQTKEKHQNTETELDEAQDARAANDCSSKKTRRRRGKDTASPKKKGRKEWRKGSKYTKKTQKGKNVSTLHLKGAGSCCARNGLGMTGLVIFHGKAEKNRGGGTGVSGTSRTPNIRRSRGHNNLSTKYAPSADKGKNRAKKSVKREETFNTDGEERIFQRVKSSNTSCKSDQKKPEEGPKERKRADSLKRKREKAAAVRGTKRAGGRGQGGSGEGYSRRAKKVENHSRRGCQLRRGSGEERE